MGIMSGATIAAAFLLFSIFQVGLNQGAAKPEQFDEWSRRLSESGVKQENVIARLHFYFHDIVSGNNPSSILVAQAAGAAQSPTGFGILRMADDALTEGPDRGSRLLGRAKGLYGTAGMGEVALIMAMSYHFTDGEYNGSSISVNGLNPVTHPVRELAIVGGTGAFRLARGVAIAKTYWFNATSGDAIVEYNVTVVH